MYCLLPLLNLLVSLASAGASVIALLRPGSLSGSRRVTRGERFYVQMYAARAVPFGLAARILPLWDDGPAAVGVLFTAAAIQLVDVVLAVRQRERGMLIGATVGALVHFLCGVARMQGVHTAPKRVE